MSTGNAPNNTTWYVATPEGKQEGPISIASVKERLRSGNIQPVQLVWREGMADWTPAGQVPELAVAPAGPAPGTAPVAAPPVAGPMPTAAAPNPYQAPTSPPATAPLKGSAPVEALLAEMSSPKFFRNFGRGCGIAGIIVLLCSIALYFFGFAQFTFGAILCLMWMIGEGTAAILHSLERLGVMVSQQREDKK